MGTYIPAIQEQLRRDGYPLEREGRIQQLVLGADDRLQLSEEQRWEYRSKDRRWSVLVTEDSVILQTTSYDRFEHFAEALRRAVQTVLSVTENDHLGAIERLGLRYVDVIQPRSGEDFRAYLRPGLHGVTDDVFAPHSHRLNIENAGATEVAGMQGTMAIRVMQNDQGLLMPPDLIAGAPLHDPPERPGKLITLVDMDHYIEGLFAPSSMVDWVINSSYALHDQLIETFHNHVVTPEAIEIWK